MDKRVESKYNSEIIEASHIIVKPDMMPMRIVLRLVDNEFITHKECLMSETPTDGSGCRFVHHGFVDGHYFWFKPEDSNSKNQAKQKAYKNFEQRLKVF